MPLPPPLTYPDYFAEWTKNGAARRPFDKEFRSRVFAVHEGGGVSKELDTHAWTSWISPNGRWAVVLRSQFWSPVDPRQHGPLDFLLVELSSGHVQNLNELTTGPVTASGAAEEAIATPRSPQTAVWSSDSAHILLINARFPGDTYSETEAHGVVGYVMDYALDARRLRAIEPMATRVRSTEDRVVGARWLKAGRELLITHEVSGKSEATTVYKLDGDQWVGSGAGSRSKSPPERPAQSLPSRLSVTLRQSANDPPMVVAAVGKQELALTPGDPALVGIWRARMEPFSWQDPSGREMTGGLMLPKEFKDGSHIPLVIQPYYYFPEYFLPDGETPTGDAAQSLVARGIAVLQIDITDAGKPQEIPTFVARIDAIVDALARMGTIDPSRVGVVGFSRAGYQTFGAITHPGRIRLGAVVCEDSYTGSYPWYLQEAGKGGRTEEIVDNYGGSDFWHGKQRWLELETTFNIDRVNAPALFTSTGEVPYSPYSEETIGAFRLNRKPIEWEYFPTGIHTLVRPRERLAAMQATVDWMAFWLLDELPSDQERAAHWSSMKAAWVQEQRLESSRK